MAFSSYRGPQSPQDSVPFPGYANNPLSPPRNSNRLSAGMLGSTTTNNLSETRAGLTRRFTTNALPTLSPIGQQRRQAAGDTTQVSARVNSCARSGTRSSAKKTKKKKGQERLGLREVKGAAGRCVRIVAAILEKACYPRNREMTCMICVVESWPQLDAREGKKNTEKGHVERIAANESKSNQLLVRCKWWEYALTS